ncbi:MAG: hypothetical protein J0H57_09165, partial [Rhodospirillales bacterium]|nr:hypothetical protein [Rhodospirillales bacterium]
MLIRPIAGATPSAWLYLFVWVAVLVDQLLHVPAAGGSAEVRGIRTRRMLMAIYRGFCVMNCWSPLNLMTAVVSTAVPAAPMRLLLPIAFVVSLGMTGLGWLEDRIGAPRRPAAGAGRPVTEERWTIHLRVIALVLLVMLLAEAGSLGFG